MQWTFGTFLWSTVIFFFWFAVIWMFISVFADVLRRDMSGWAKAGWIVFMVVLPFIGILAYLIARPRSADSAGQIGSWGYSGDRSYSPSHEQKMRDYNAADEIATAARLHDQGKISADEYEYLKQQALSH